MLSVPASIPAPMPADLTTGFGVSTPRRRSSRSCRPAVSASCITGTGVRPRRGSDHRNRRDGVSSFPLRDSPVLVPESIVWQLRASCPTGALVYAPLTQSG